MMTSFYNLLKYAQTGIASPDMTYFDKMRASTLMGGVVKTLTGIPPLSFPSDGSPLISWSMKGNGQQSGTPTHDNPVMPTFCGVRTANLFDSAVYELVPVSASTQRKGTNLGVLPHGTYTFNAVSTASAIPIYRTIKNGNTYTFEAINSLPYTFTADGVSEQIIQTSGTKGNTWADAGYSNMMLNSGSTALPYEPYGWKVPFENHGENLFDVTSITHEALDTSGAKRYESAMDLSGFIEVDGDYTVSWKAVRSGAYMRVSTFDENKIFIARITEVNTFKNTHYSNSHTGYIRINYENSYGLSDIMLNPGTTPKPYSPYLNETFPVYLGEVPTVRRVKKLVLDGTEAWERQSGQTVDYFRIANMPAIPSKVICTHYQSPDENIAYATTAIGIKMQQSASYGVILACRPSLETTSLTDFKAFLAAQYAAGTPVTVWYVLATPETGTINEPLAKIGDYADELRSADAGVTIPTVKGQNVLTVDTELQPSEMTIKYHE